MGITTFSDYGNELRDDQSGIAVKNHTTSLTVSQNFGICSEPRSMGNAIASWRERPPVSGALLQSS